VPRLSHVLVPPLCLSSFRDPLRLQCLELHWVTLDTGRLDPPQSSFFRSGPSFVVFFFFPVSERWFFSYCLPWRSLMIFVYLIFSTFRDHWYPRGPPLFTPICCFVSPLPCRSFSAPTTTPCPPDLREVSAYQDTWTKGRPEPVHLHIYMRAYGFLPLPAPVYFPRLRSQLPLVI